MALHNKDKMTLFARADSPDFPNFFFSDRPGFWGGGIR
jgi:hypothetical protein